MKPTFHPALRLLVFPALLAPGLRAQDPPVEREIPIESPQSPTIPIEQKVLTREAGSVTQSIAELAQTASRTETPEDKKRLLTSLGKYAVWLTDVNAQIRQIGLLPDDMSEQLTSNATTLNDVAWRMVTGPEFADTPHEIAKHFSAVAVSWAPNSPPFLDTYARTLALTGDLAQAVTLQRRAVEISSTNPIAGIDFQPTLDAYLKGEIPSVEAPAEWAQELTEQEDTDTDAVRINDVAWHMVASDKQSPVTALELANIALQQPIRSSVTRARILDTQARALYMSGRQPQAISRQESAVQNSHGDAELRTSLRETLARYREGGSLSPYAKEGRFAANYEEDSKVLNEIAWQMLQGEKEGSTETALKLAVSARIWLESNRGIEPMIVDTIALAYFKLGNLPQAIELQKEAIQMLTERPDPDQALLQELTATLQRYEQQRTKEGIPVIPPGVPIPQAAMSTSPRPRPRVKQSLTARSVPSAAAPVPVPVPAAPQPQPETPTPPVESAPSTPPVEPAPTPIR